MPNQETSEETKKESSSSRLASAAMWLGGSALFGSLALVLWNRRALKSMREAAEIAEKPPPINDDDGIY
jgi:hypothetical protein